MARTYSKKQSYGKSLADAQTEYDKYRGSNPADADGSKRFLDLYRFAVEKGFNPRTYVDNFEQFHGEVYEQWVQDYLDENGLLQEAQAQAGTVNQARMKGYQGEDLNEANQFLDSYNASADIARKAGMSVTPTTTFKELETFSSQNQKSFNQAAAENVRAPDPIPDRATLTSNVMTTKPTSTRAKTVQINGKNYKEGSPAHQRVLAGGASSTVPQGDATGFVESNGAYFERTPSGLKIITDPQKLTQARTSAQKLNTQQFTQEYTRSGGGSGIASGAANSKAAQETIRGTRTEYDDSLDSILAGSGLSSDEQNALRAFFDTVSTNDEEAADRLKAQLDLGSTYADPLFKQQLRLYKDSLDRSLGAADEDLSFEEEQKSKALSDLRADIEKQKGYLSLEQQSELAALEDSYNQNLTELRDNLAASGFTFSGRRQEKEKLLSDETGRLRETSQRKFGLQQDTLSTQLDRGQRDTAAEIERLRELTKRGKLDTYRTAEEQLGSSNLPKVSGMKGLGDVTGNFELERQRNRASFIF